MTTANGKHKVLITHEKQDEPVWSIIDMEFDDLRDAVTLIEETIKANTFLSGLKGCGRNEWKVAFNGDETIRVKLIRAIGNSFVAIDGLTNKGA